MSTERKIEKATSGCPMRRSSLLRLVAALGLGFLIPPALRPVASLAAPGDMGLVMTLFRNHERINRTVEEVSGGIRATTESDDPRVASLIQAHVTSMYQRVNQGRPFTMMSRTLPTMFRNAKRYERHLTMTSKGVSITETSTDPQMIAVIRAHGREVTGFVDEGMSAMMNGMMGGGMMQGR